jgi:hypothetical protein
MDTRICPRCEKKLSINNFRKKGNAYQPYCIECNKKYGKEHYLNNRQYYYLENKRLRESRKKWFKGYRLTLECSKCGEKNIACLDFHHKNALKKDIGIAEAVNRGWSIKRIEGEIKKCDVLCSNCHRKLHWKEIKVE